jgi:hypothetical protein
LLRFFDNFYRKFRMVFWPKTIWWIDIRLKEKWGFGFRSLMLRLGEWPDGYLFVDLGSPKGKSSGFGLEFDVDEFMDFAVSVNDICKELIKLRSLDPVFSTDAAKVMRRIGLKPKTASARSFEPSSLTLELKRGSDGTPHVNLQSAASGEGLHASKGLDVDADAFIGLTNSVNTISNEIRMRLPRI